MPETWVTEYFPCNVCEGKGFVRLYDWSQPQGTANALPRAMVCEKCGGVGWFPSQVWLLNTGPMVTFNVITEAAGAQPSLR